MNDEEKLLQASALPYRRDGDQIEFCLVTSTNKKWIIPKGTIKANETPADTALRNARSEAGLHGNIVGPRLGKYCYGKWEMICDVTVYLMHVDECDEEWQDEEKRQRRWVSKDEALELLSRKELKESLETAWERLQEGVHYVKGHHHHH